MTSEPQQFVQSVVLGLVEGITEFLPISSMAHMKVVPMLLGWGDPGLAVGAVIQLGSISAVICYFRKDLLAVMQSVIESARKKDWNHKNTRLGLAILVGTLPVVIAGLATHQRELSDIRVKDGVLVGIAQTLAIIPGVSRSGSTLTASLFDNWKRDDAARFSFLLGIPAITLGGLAELKDAFADGATYGIMPLFAGVVTAFISSLFVIHFFIRYLQTNTTIAFVIYRLAFGTFLITAGNAIQNTQ